MDELPDLDKYYLLYGGSKEQPHLAANLQVHQETHLPPPPPTQIR